MRRTILIISVTLLTLSCSRDFSFFKVHNQNEYTTISEKNDLAKLNERKIELSGVFHIDFENIYLESKGEKIWVDFNFFSNLKNSDGKNLTGEDLTTYDAKHVKIKGKYISGKTGHLGAYDGKITDIVFFGRK